MLLEVCCFLKNPDFFSIFVLENTKKSSVSIVYKKANPRTHQCLKSTRSPLIFTVKIDLKLIFNRDFMFNTVQKYHVSVLGLQ